MRRLSLFLASSLVACIPADEWKPQPQVVTIVEGPDQALWVGGTDDRYRSWTGRVDGARIVDAHLIDSQGDIESLGFRPEGTFLAAMNNGTNVHVIESKDRREWSYPRVMLGSFINFRPDGGWSYDSGDRSYGTTPARVDAAGKERLLRDQGAEVVCGERGLLWEGGVVKLVEGEAGIGGRVIEEWSYQAAPSAWLIGEDHVVIQGLDGVWRHRVGKERELVVKNDDTDYGDLTALQVTAAGDIIFANETEKRFDFAGIDGLRLTRPFGEVDVPLQPQRRTFRCVSDTVVRRGDQLWIAGGTLSLLDLRTGQVTRIEPPAFD